MKEIAKYDGCFVCGHENEYGLKARFFFSDGKAVTECTAQRHFEGYRGIYHGGVMAALLDEVMIKALLAKDIFAMTVELTVKFHKAVAIGQKLHLEGCLEHQKGRLFLTVGEARLACRPSKLDAGEIVASASGKYLQVKEDMKVKLMQPLKT
ncbi:MAG: PaaI family thioesterase [candidate division Zixibacteria bacterium]|nr:PaaI family thioesterase [candidate division Zixibacteria bacterium]